MNDQDFRDACAMLALNGILACNYDVGEEPAILAYKHADAMLEARKPSEEGIVAIKRKVKTK